MKLVAVLVALIVLNESSDKLTDEHSETSPLLAACRKIDDCEKEKTENQSANRIYDAETEKNQDPTVQEKSSTADSKTFAGSKKLCRNFLICRKKDCQYQHPKDSTEITESSNCIYYTTFPENKFGKLIEFLDPEENKIKLEYDKQKGWALFINAQNIVTEGKIEVLPTEEIQVIDLENGEVVIAEGKIAEKDRQRVIEEITTISEYEMAKKMCRKMENVFQKAEFKLNDYAFEKLSSNLKKCRAAESAKKIDNAFQKAEIKLKGLAFEKLSTRLKESKAAKKIADTLQRAEFKLKSLAFVNLSSKMEQSRVTERKAKQDEKNCKYYMCSQILKQTPCNFGDSCKFGHIVKKGMRLKTEDCDQTKFYNKICPYLINNNSCKMGIECKYQHVYEQDRNIHSNDSLKKNFVCSDFLQNIRCKDEPCLFAHKVEQGMKLQLRDCHKKYQKLRESQLRDRVDSTKLNKDRLLSNVICHDLIESECAKGIFCRFQHVEKEFLSHENAQKNVAKNENPENTSFYQEHTSQASLTSNLSSFEGMWKTKDCKKVKISNVGRIEFDPESTVQITKNYQGYWSVIFTDSNTATTEVLCVSSSPTEIVWEDLSTNEQTTWIKISGKFQDDAFEPTFEAKLDDKDRLNTDDSKSFDGPKIFVCSNFLRQQPCKHGRSCRFTHAVEKGMKLRRCDLDQSRPSDKICLYLILHKFCTKQDCKYQHVEAKLLSSEFKSKYEELAPKNSEETQGKNTAEDIARFERIWDKLQTAEYLSLEQCAKEYDLLGYDKFGFQWKRQCTVPIKSYHFHNLKILQTDEDAKETTLIESVQYNSHSTENYCFGSQVFEYDAELPIMERVVYLLPTMENTNDNSSKEQNTKQYQSSKYFVKSGSESFEDGAVLKLRENYLQENSYQSSSQFIERKCFSIRKTANKANKHKMYTRTPNHLNKGLNEKAADVVIEVRPEIQLETLVSEVSIMTKNTLQKYLEMNFKYKAPMEWNSAQLKGMIMEIYFFDYAYEFKVPEKVDLRLQSLIILMSELVDVCRRGKYNYNPILIASQFGVEKAILKLIEKGAKVDAVCEFGLTALHYASFYGRLGACQVLLRQNVEINARGWKFGNTAISLAEENGNLEVVQLLLSYGADTKLKDQNGKRILDYDHHCPENHPRLCSFQIIKEYEEKARSKSAEIKSKNHGLNKKTVDIVVEVQPTLETLVSEVPNLSKSELREYLQTLKSISNTTNFTIKTKWNMNKLKSKIMETYFFDSPYEYVNIPEDVDPKLQNLIFLMSELIGVKRRAKYNYTPIIIAAMFGADKAISKLVERGGLSDPVCEFGMGAIHYASFFGRLESSRVLLQQKSTNVDAQDQFGNTALILAATNSHHELVQLLLEHGADAELMDMNGNTALLYAKPSCAAIITRHQEQKRLKYIKKNGEMTTDGFWQTTTETFRTTFEQDKIAHEFLFEGNSFVISRFKGASIFYRCLDNLEEIEFSYNMDSWEEKENALKKNEEVLEEMCNLHRSEPPFSECLAEEIAETILQKLVHGELVDKSSKSGAYLDFYLDIEQPDEVIIRGQEIDIHSISYDELKFKVFSTRAEREKLRIKENKKLGVDEFFSLYRQQKI